MSSNPHAQLSRRERQLMDIIYRAGSASAAEVRAAMPDPPSYSAVRAMLRVLEEKGHLRHEADRNRYVFRPTVSRDRARRSALRNLMQTFFDGSAGQTMAALIDLTRSNLDDEDLERLARLIERAREEGR